MVVTAYPGASAYQVELEVTDVLEKAIRSMGDLDHVSSRSMDDVSEIMVELSSTVPLAELQQKWDILRRKVMGVQAQLPEGAQPSIVMDDFGDVYGMFYAMTSDGFDYQEMSDYAELVRRSVLDIDGVSSVDVYGERQSCINVEFLEDKMANMGVHPAEIIMTLNGQNKTVYSGYFDSGEKQAERNLARLFGPRPRDHKSLRIMPPEFVDDVMHPLWKTGFSGVLNLEVFSVEDFTASHAVLMQSWERYAASS